MFFYIFCILPGRRGQKNKTAKVSHILICPHKPAPKPLLNLSVCTWLSWVHGVHYRVCCGLATVAWQDVGATSVFSVLLNQMQALKSIRFKQLCGGYMWTTCQELPLLTWLNVKFADVKAHRGLVAPAGKGSVPDPSAVVTFTFSWLYLCTAAGISDSTKEKVKWNQADKRAQLQAYTKRLCYVLLQN